MDNNMFQRLKDLVTQHQTIGIITPPNPNLDEMAAGLGMYLVLKQMGKNVAIACPTNPTVGLSSLIGIDKVQRSLGSPSGSGAVGGDVVVSFPYRDGEIEKVSYTVDNGKLNIVVKAGPNGLSFSQSDVMYQQQQTTSAGTGNMPSLLFLIGVADPMSVTSILPQNTTGITVVNIDNKPTNTGYGDVVHLSDKFSSVSEEVADFLTLLEPQVELDKDTSQNLLSGILSATNNFQDGKGSYLGFEMAGILMKKGAVRNVSGQVAQPTTPSMQPSAYFPPVQPVAPIAPQQQVTPMVNQPVAPVQQAEPQPQQSVQSPVQNQQPPSDWLTPKVYKGSTVL